ncbi:MAG: SAM-dependent methyltransferase [Kangiellaceae bacterium]|jgi:SAM-dependent MidA family methyltransferase|nr:SAM-dependent methyltransferase [Kangiellaceae bacterium]
MLSASKYQNLLFEQASTLGISSLSEQEITTSFSNYQAIVAAIETSDDSSISFAEFVDLALYQPLYGYYVSGKEVLGDAGDFITAPEISPLFGYALLESIKTTLKQSAGHIYEFGGGSGKLAKAILEYAHNSNIPIESYNIIEVSPALIDTQKNTLATINDITNQPVEINWCEQLPDEIDGCVIANEVLDAIACHRVKKHNSTILENRIVLEQGILTSTWLPPRSPEVIEWLSNHHDKLDWQDNNIVEIAPWRSAWLKTVSDKLRHGAMVFIDYGYSADQFFHQQRVAGTVKCFIRQTSNDHYLSLLGLQDITSHVNFSELSLAAEQAGLTLTGFTEQGQWIIESGVLNFKMSDSLVERTEQAYAIQQLTMPQNMGEIVKVIAFSRQLPDNAQPKISSRLVSRL